MADLPIACTLTPDALKVRRENLVGALLSRSIERSELPEGLRLCFTADSGILHDIARTVEAERRCCRFLRFTITVPEGEGPIALEMTGPAGTREFLAALFDQP